MWWYTRIKRILETIDEMFRYSDEIMLTDAKENMHVIERHFAYGREEIVLPDGRRIVREWRKTDRDQEPIVREYTEEQRHEEDRSVRSIPAPLPVPDPLFPLRPPRPTFPPEDNDLLLDVIDGGNEVFIIAEVPATRLEEIEVKPEGDSLKIHCGGKTLHSINLPEDVDVSRMQINLKNGVLEIRIPKK